MSWEDINAILSRNENAASQSLDNFLSKKSQTFSFPELDRDDLRENFWLALFHFLQTPSASVLHMQCLSAVRILSRDKSKLNDLMREKWLDILLQLAGLQSANVEGNRNTSTNYSIMIEADKSLCNLVFNSSVAQAICSKNGTAEGIVNRLRTFRDPELPYEIKYFDMRLLFLITALCPEVRSKLVQELHGMTYLIETLGLILKEATGEGEISADNRCSNVMDDQTSLSDKQIDLACEILKVLFNLTVRPQDVGVDEEEDAHYARLVNVLHDLLLSSTQSADKRPELHSHIVNLLTSVPTESLASLAGAEVKGQHLPKEFEFEGHSMEALYTLVQFLKARFDVLAPSGGQQEFLCPILTVLLKAASSSRVIRKYVRQQVLPPLKDVHHRPEEGTALRNHLCRLLTLPATQLKELAAEFLFVLCKQNVSRMIKYTGYGNAAGLFARRGLLGSKQAGDPVYSSDSENSDTEEYSEHRHGINPVVGCFQPPRQDPMEGMSDEQKEYEAMKLVNLIDDMTRKGIVQPCKISEDGRPVPIEHVLELQESLPKQQVNQDSDLD